MGGAVDVADADADATPVYCWLYGVFLHYLAFWMETNVVFSSEMETNVDHLSLMCQALPGDAGDEVDPSEYGHSVDRSAPGIPTGSLKEGTSEEISRVAIPGCDAGAADVALLEAAGMGVGVLCLEAAWRPECFLYCFAAEVALRDVSGVLLYCYAVEVALRDVFWSVFLSLWLKWTEMPLRPEWPCAFNIRSSVKSWICEVLVLFSLD
ncbi:hypothetical protein Nepgr_020436 [Nepenthes gracilis]|uniref:Uncharacterized protein n=1 Tax=Nepenthes gracilis TaxID=150966 RepID=A0AAD3SWV2_NEPGR|nr:hypothetical protein Nepgr_020436 [Nepenthes gracilis]